MSHPSVGKDVNMEAEKSTMLRAATKQRLVKTAELQDLVHAILNSKFYELIKML
jgi:hypothetical protein